MTVAVAVSQITVVWAGVTDWVALGLQMAAAVDARLYRLDGTTRVLLVAGVHYETRIDGAGLLSVRMMAGALPAPPFSILAQRVTPALQPTVFSDYVPFDGRTIERRFDDGALRDSELRRDVDDLDARTAAIDAHVSEVDAATVALAGRATALEAADVALSARLGVVELNRVAGSDPTGQVTLTSPSFVGAPTAPTQPAGDASTKIATDEFVTRLLPNAAYSRIIDIPAGAPPFALRHVEWGDYHRLLAVNTGAGFKPALSPLIDGKDAAERWVMGMPGAWHGLDLQYYSATQLLLQPGTWNATSPDKIMGSPANILFNPTNTVGLNGCDMNYSGGSPAMNAGWYYIYLLGKSSNAYNDTKIVLSKSITLGPVRTNLNANAPGSSVYNYIRKFPVAVYFDGTAFRPFRISGGWPYPCVSYVGASMGAAGAFITNGTYTSETTISVAGWAPDNGRLIELGISIVSGGTAGDAYVRTPGVPGTGLIMPVSATAGEKRAYPYLKLQASSSLGLIFYTPPGAQITASVLGFWASEQS